MERNKEFYSRFIKYGIGAWTSAWNPITQRLAHESMMKHLDFGGSSVLDLGCGNGEFLFNLVLAGQTPRRFVGIELLEEVVKICLRRFKKLAESYAPHYLTLIVKKEDYPWLQLNAPMYTVPEKLG